MLAVSFPLFYACFNSAFLLVFMKYYLEHSQYYGKKNNYILKVLIEKVGNKNSPYVLGFLREQMSETQILEKKCRVAKMMNANLKAIGKRLNLSIELLSETSRDAYATTLKKNGRSIEEIAEMLGHSSTTCTRNYLAQFEENQIHSINQGLF
jgi:integrase